ncbi:hypothetical protein HDU93_004588, partial [Gonapodya sp. JEL0774]
MTAPAAAAPVKTVNFEHVGWLFVQEFYTFLNKNPEKLHNFYNKKSYFIHGTEAQTVKLCHGTQEIHQRITELDFQDCKVLVSNVDSQASINGGILVQVLGELSNRGRPSQKFAQTFFLAEQPSGYFVLNDIFRFLKEDIDTADQEDLSAYEGADVHLGGPDGAVSSLVEDTYAEQQVPSEPEPAPVQSVPVPEYQAPVQAAHPSRGPSPSRRGPSPAPATSPSPVPVAATAPAHEESKPTGHGHGHGSAKAHKTAGENGHNVSASTPDA